MKLNKLIALLLAVTMLFAFVSCPHGNEPEEPVDNTPANNQPSTPDTLANPDTPANPDTSQAPAKPAAPVISPNGGVVNIGTLVTITTETEGAFVVYKFGEVSENTAEYTVYNAEAKPVIEVASKIAAMAVTGTEGAYVYSDVVTAEFTIAKVEDPVISPNGSDVASGQAVTLSCATEEAEISYKFGEDGEWTEYTAAIVISDDTTITAKAEKAGEKVSAEETGEYTIVVSAAPAITLEAGAYPKGTKVTITAADGAEIAYGFGSNFSEENYTLYSAAQPVINADDTLYAVAIEPNKKISEVVSAAYTAIVAAKPVFSKADAVLADEPIEITCATEVASIFYKEGEGE